MNMYDPVATHVRLENKATWLTRVGTADEKILQTEVTPKPDWRVARQWIEECIERHPTCSGQSDNGKSASSVGSPQLPTRLLDVGNSGDDEICLVETNDTNRISEYTTLSHCWGGKKFSTTTSSNYDQNLKSIPLSSMPRTFQDAVITTRELGFRYLWIDSLCIIQGSKEDWELECCKMADIFRGSRVTLCGPKASNVSVGFLHPRQSSVQHIWEYANAEKAELKRATFRLTLDPADDERFRPCGPWLCAPESQSRLESRGWILQEYLLSPRVIFFGEFRMYWECHVCVQFEDVPGQQVSLEKGLHCKVSKRDFNLSDAATEVDWSNIWYSVVRDYTKRKLTAEGDKLPAISGIARWAVGDSNERYLAGLLRHAVQEGLAWYIPADKQTKQISPIRTYRAPSWSWASTDFPLNFVSLERRSNAASLSAEYRLDILDSYIKRLGLAPLGEVISGASITIKGRSKPAVVVRLAGSYQYGHHLEDGEYGEYGDWGPNHYEYRDSDEYGDSDSDEDRAVDPDEENWLGIRDPVSDKIIGSFFPDDPVLWKSLPRQEGGELQEWTSQQEITCLCIDYFKVIGTWAAIVLEPVEAKQNLPDAQGTDSSDSAGQKYRRIGLVVGWNSSISVYHGHKMDRELLRHWFRDCTPQVMDLV